ITLTAESGECKGKASQTIKILAPQPKDRSTNNHFGGCNPYAFNFKAEVAYADTFLWEFGDFEASSNEEDPSYIYDRTGRFYIDLWAGGPGTEGKLVYIRRDTIDVYPTPFADFNPLPKTVLLPNQAVYCNNLTLDGEYYIWDFGDDSEVSTDPDPSHYYTKAGTYNISLKAYTENECFDDTTITDAVTVLEPGFVKFPSAFKPNTTGPSDGTWTRRDETNDVFHAVHRGVDEFKLEIFNRWGEKVFESNDPSIGWNGYVNGKLASQDVYVWKVSGKYINGVQFKKAGDLTLIR
ncbi:MAG: PKD domain-containing protein, partial [Chloroflexia bacterium]|nr:PKD domain-containing protein [Chloroflexia bacterium]